MWHEVHPAPIAITLIARKGHSNMVDKILADTILLEWKSEVKFSPSFSSQITATIDKLARFWKNEDYTHE